MPLQKCSSSGKSGWRWGNSGKCYTGPGAKKSAIKQGLAIEGEDGFKKKVNANLYSESEYEAAVADLIENGVEQEPAFGDQFMDAVHAYISKEERDKVATEDFGDPSERKYPIRNAKDVESAAKLLGRAPKSKQAAIKERIKRIAKRKGLKLPESWGD